MQRKKKIVAKNSSREQANRSFRQPKKRTLVSEKNIRELITSSARKQRNIGILRGNNNDTQSANISDTSYDVSQVEKEHLILQSSVNNKPSEDVPTESVVETVFSPTYHFPKDVCGDIADRDDIIFPMSADDSDKRNGHSQILEVKLNYPNSSCDEEYADLGNISTEVSEIYLAMQHSKLEHVDESNSVTMTTDSCATTDEDDEFDEFDPLLFMKNLPDLHLVVPRFRHVLLPKQTRSCPSTTLVLDLDETLVHSTLEPCEDADFTIQIHFNMNDQNVYVRCRPYLKDFVERVSSLFEVIIFTASQRIYAKKLLDTLDPKRKLFRHRVYRDSCVYVEGNYLKDLSVLGRDLARVIIVDNSPQAFGFQVDNGIPIDSWFDDRKDCNLLKLLPFLESLVGVDDVRPVIANKFNLREKIAAAASDY